MQNLGLDVRDEKVGAALQAGGPRFEPATAHHPFKWELRNGTYFEICSSSEKNSASRVCGSASTLSGTRSLGTTFGRAETCSICRSSWGIRASLQRSVIYRALEWRICGQSMIGFHYCPSDESFMRRLLASLPDFNDVES